MLILINDHAFPSFEPGTLYNPFYPQGFNSAVSTYTLLSFPFSEPSYLQLSKAFTLFSTIMIAFYPIAIYSLAEQLTTDKKISILSALSFIPIAAREFVTAGHLAENLGIILLSGLLVISIQIMNRRYRVPMKYTILFVTVFVSIVLTHIVAMVFSILIILILLLWERLKDNIDTTSVMKLLFQFVFCVLFSLLFMYITDPSLAHGTFEEAIRKNMEPGLGWIPTSPGSYFIDSLKTTYSNLKESVSLYLVPFFFIGFVKCLQKFRGFLIPLLLSSTILILIPILPYNRPSYLLVYPMAIISGIGLYSLFKVLANGDNILRFIIILIVSILLVGGISDSIERSQYWGEQRTSYWPEEEYYYSFELADWLDENTTPTQTIACPDSGPLGYILLSSVKNTVLFSDPKWVDIPSFQEISLLYDDQTLDKRRAEIIKKWDISIILVIGYSDWYLENLEKIISSVPGSNVIQVTDIHYVIEVNKDQLTY